MFSEGDLCFTDLETAIRSPLAEAPTPEGVFLQRAALLLGLLRGLSESAGGVILASAGDIDGALAEIRRCGRANRLGERLHMMVLSYLWHLISEVSMAI